MAGQVEQDDFLFARFLAFICFAYSGCNGVAGLRCRDDSFCLCEKAAGFELFELFDVRRFHIAVFQQLRYDDAGTVIAQTAGVYVGGSEIMS